MKLYWFVLPAFLLASCTTNNFDQKPFKLGEFGAFYTRIISGEEFEKYSRTGEYADIVVDLGQDNSTFVFWRGSSYLPYLETPAGKWYVEEVIPREGDGEGVMSDRINTFSHVRIIENQPGKVIIHWRYLPEFSGKNRHTGVDTRNFVDEYFTITSDLRVSRTIRKGTEKIDDWRDPKNRILQTFDLTPGGIRNLTSSKASTSYLTDPVSGSPVISDPAIDPVAWWKFDEGNGDITLENISGESSMISGHKSIWKKGL